MSPVTEREELQRPRASIVKSAEIAGVTKRTIYNWMRLGRIEYVRTPSAGVRIFVDTLLYRETEHA